MNTMQDGLFYFSSQFFGVPRGAITIQAKDPKFQNIIGRAPDASFGDIKQANLMYKCDGKNPHNFPALSALPLFHLLNSQKCL